MIIHAATRQGTANEATGTIRAFRERLFDVRSAPLTALAVDVLQMNLGDRCNMACRHCHVNSGPGGKRQMSRDVAGAVLRAVKASGIRTLDITGGAPEMNPLFADLVAGATGAGCHVLVRTNLTVLLQAGMERLPSFLAGHSVEVVASLPCYTPRGVDQVRGRGTFERCIAALRKLNALGYGGGREDRRLCLVYNPAGAFLPAPQQSLEDDFRRELGSRYGVSFDRLYAFSNVPAGRFRDFLLQTNGLQGYMELLSGAFNPGTTSGLMCRRIVSVGWDGRLHDCDFNLALGVGVTAGYPRTIEEFDPARLSGREINVADHCYACTAGQGST